ncbi:hypothetical protein CB1_000413015 [Camelus ferus]|nr:hypothetical protein CB1_000413015 [Camelus ferus]
MEVMSGFTCPELFGSAQAGEGGDYPLSDFPTLCLLRAYLGISSPVKKTEMDKSPFNSPSPQDSPRLSSFTQHHRPVIAVHSAQDSPLNLLPM